MKEAEFEKLIEKYKNGDSTLKEEIFLFNSTKELRPSLEAWATFVKNSKTQTPKDFNDRLWQSFQNKTNKKRKLFVKSIGVAASIIILVSLFIGNLDQNGQSHAEKERLLNQARDMFKGNEQEKIHRTIFYENEMIIVYLTTE